MSIKYTFIENQTHSYVACLPGEELLSSEQDALDLVGVCGAYGTNRLLLSEGCLAPAFYNLKSGLAGVVMLKFSNYHIRAAAVLPNEIAHTGRFGEFVYETNQGQQFRVYPTIEEAEAWLINY